MKTGSKVLGAAAFALVASSTLAMRLIGKGAQDGREEDDSVCVW